MSMLRLYTRVLELLGKEARLGWILAVANLLLAGAQFAEPVLFGKIIDVMSGRPVTGLLATDSPWPLVGAWAVFGLFMLGFVYLMPSGVAGAIRLLSAKRRSA